MPHPVIENKTPFEAELLFAADEEGRPLVASLIKATFSIAADGQISLASEQRPVNYAGSWWGGAGESSYQFEPEVAFSKPATDVILHGVARPHLRGQTEIDVNFRVGPVRQRALVLGPRVWNSGLLGMKISAPAPLEEVPLLYENAFGGWDRTPSDEAHHRAWEANSVGRGFYTSRGKPSEGDPLPSIECHRNGLRKVGGKARTVGFGFTQPHWQPRARFAGTFDEDWDQTRRPLLPLDFDRRHWNAAAPELIADGFLRGDELVLVEGTVPQGRLHFELVLYYSCTDPTCT
ncbi:MAG: DUF2169 domain-containing protein [Planctomycetota bacterium]